MLLFAYPIKRNVRRGNVTGQNGRSIKKSLVRDLVVVWGYNIRGWWWGFCSDYRRLLWGSHTLCEYRSNNSHERKKERKNKLCSWKLGHNWENNSVWPNEVPFRVTLITNSVTRLFVQYLAIFNTKSFPSSIKNCQSWFLFLQKN